MKAFAITPSQIKKKTNKNKLRQEAIDESP